jgi:hypothetical protein
MQSLGTEMRYIARRLVRAPLFTVVAVATLGIGIGANSATFSVVNGVLGHRLVHLIRNCLLPAFRPAAARAAIESRVARTGLPDSQTCDFDGAFLYFTV